ncbi:hypothetical protein GCM10008171_26090 [Methylopila jiangsuensis]|uniref:Toxin n=1 Tax=Methylopila jiangsuensis TaxID=586230 RepID=A0A9W6JGT7_9HYPH|nr:type II toxin-antitoxin system RelE/ParE family toxin [Methylopila jiangsuensis]MDR6285255.1 toxin ParE1/3/4 [Methylopila jiangsuensis]GLK77355.1 hypothetical protein GCM10008171_26090 [Methylopila jiangsuensis]
MAYRTTAAAKADLFALFRYGVENFGVAKADAYFSDLLDALDLVSDAPGVGVARPELDPPCRVLFHRLHAIYYGVESDGGVLILRVLHATRDWRRHL